jgi:hypothetical protein
MADFSNFSSLPPNQEAGFVVYEQRMAAAQQSGFTMAIVAAIATLVVAVGIYLGVAPDDDTDKMTQGMNMSNLTRAPSQAPAASDTPAAPAPAAPAAPAPTDGSGAAPAPAPSGSATTP